MSRIIPRDFFYAVVIFVMLVAGITSVLSMVTTESKDYGGATVNLFADSNRSEIAHFNDTFNKQTQIVNKTRKLKDDLSDLQPETTLEAITLPVAFIKTAWDMIDFIISSFGFMDSAIQGLSGFLHLPTWTTILIIALISILFIFSILSMIFGKDI